MQKNTRRFLGRVLSFVMFTSVCLSNLNISVWAAEGRKIDVWDMGGIAEADTALYNNNFTAADWDNNENLAGGKLAAGTTTVGDFTLTHNANDRVYYPGSKSYAETWTYMALDYGDYNSNGCAYFNGTGGETRRFVTIDNVVPGDRIRIYGSFSNSTPSEKVHFKAVNGTQDTVDEWVDQVPHHSDFVAEEAGQYKIYWDVDNGGKPIFHRVVRYPAITVTASVDKAGNNVSGYGIKFINQETKAEYEGTVSADGSSVTAELPSGYTYSATMTGVQGFGFTNATRYIETSIDKTVSGITTSLTVEPKQTYTISGKLDGFAEGYDVSKLNVIFDSDPDSGAEDSNATVNADMTYSATLEPDVLYTVVMEGVNDYDIIEGGSVNDNKNLTQDIKVALKAAYEVTGQIYVLNRAGVKSPAEQYSVFANSGAKELTFKNMDDGYTYTGAVNGADFTANLRDGKYEVSAAVEGYSTSSHVVVSGGNVTKNVLLAPTAANSVPYSNTVYVGDGVDADYHYASVYDAVQAINAMTPQPASEAERITVNISDGEYIGQSVLTTPYVSFVAASGTPVLSGYYGIGYKYYSVDKTQYYNPESAFDMFEKNAVTRWGAVLRLNKANYFKAEGIEFKNTFNYNVTDEEIADGVEPEKAMPERTYSLDAASKAATERAAAIAIDADFAEFYNCSFKGSQDTVYTDNHSYFKNCFISGNTDYIFGDGNAVFDGCELNWYGYSGDTTGGHIAVNKAKGPDGFLFRNCTVTYNPEHPKPTTGDFGRPWEQAAKVIFMNTKLADPDLISAAGWSSMDKAVPEKANYTEYNTTYNGAPVDTTKRVTGVVTEEPKVDVKAYFGGWTPEHYVDNGTAAPAFATAPYLSSNDDLNLPHPGNTLTVSYSIGADDAVDASSIAWYAVAADGTETLIAVSSANASKSLYLEEGKNVGSYIKAVVTPMTIDGRTGTAASIQTQNVVQEGFSNPDNPNLGPIGDGINVYLVGDSTVKDYAAGGINNATARSEGAWGEFMKYFFDDKYVNVYDHAQGGRSSRSFINDGRWDTIKSTLKKGDYVFIQFGHNDCSNDAGYVEERYVPLAIAGKAEATEKDGELIYPTYVGEKTGAAGTKYTNEWYQYNDGTFKGFMNVYIQEARELGAIPILVTPVSRMYYESGKIKTHHDAEKDTPDTYKTSGDAYVKAVFQLGEETDTPVIDMFQLTKDQFEEAYAACGSDTYGSAIMYDKTHNNKVGGILDAAVICKYIQQQMNNGLSPYVIMPTAVSSPDADGDIIFTINNKGKIATNIAKASTANKLSAEDIEAATTYWTPIIQKHIDDIANYTPSVEPKPEVTNLGDVNKDGKLEALDAALTLQHVLRNGSVDIDLQAADVDGSGVLDASDATMILQKVLKSTYQFPAAA